MKPDFESGRHGGTLWCARNKPEGRNRVNAQLWTTLNACDRPCRPVISLGLAKGRLAMRRAGTLSLALIALLALSDRALAQQTGGYTAPSQFMELFFDFSGSEEPDYPAGRPTIGQMLTQAEIARLRGPASAGPLILVVGSDIQIYDSASGASIAHERFRADRTSGFYEMTAISHIGPALAYLAQIKADGDPRWKERLASLLEHVVQVRALNARAATVSGVNDDFFDGTSPIYPIPFRNVMIATFMLDALRTAADVQAALARLKLDWANAMVLVSSRAGSNVSSGLTEGTNWLVSFLQAASGFTLPDERIKITPYMELRPSLGQPQLATADLRYYVQQVWGPLFYRRLIADRVFSDIPTIYLPGRPSLPGDPGVTPAAAIDQFMIRLKHSLRDAREMLSNTVAFWMVQHLAQKNWDPAAVDVPGLTTGFPPNVSGYPPVALK